MTARFSNKTIAIFPMAVSLLTLIVCFYESKLIFEIFYYFLLEFFISGSTGQQMLPSGKSQDICLSLNPCSKFNQARLFIVYQVVTKRLFFKKSF